MTLKVDDAIMPPVGKPRDRQPNRFDAIVKSLPVWDPESGEPQRGKKISGLTVGELKKVRRDLTRAGNDLDTPVTVVWSVGEHGDKDDDPVTIIIAARVKITKPRKTDEK